MTNDKNSNETQKIKNKNKNNNENDNLKRIIKKFLKFKNKVLKRRRKSTTKIDIMYLNVQREMLKNLFEN